MKTSQNFALLSLLLAYPYFAFAHEHHGPHVHEIGQLDLAIDKKSKTEGENKITADFNAAAPSIYDFEHVATTPAEIKKRDDKVALLKAKIGTFISLDPKLGCVWKAVKIDAFVPDKDDDDDADGKVEGQHGDFKSRFEAICNLPLAGSKAKIAFHSAFPKLKKIQVTVRSDEKQFSSELVDGEGSLQF